METLYSLWNFIRNIGYILDKLPDQLRKQKLLILKEYLLLKLKCFLFPKSKNTHTMGLFVEFFDFRQFVRQFEQLFIQNEYFFVCNTKNPVIFDGGANIGDSIIYLKWLCPDAKIVAFEPDRKTFSILKKNVSNNNITDVELVNTALSSYQGKTLFYRQESDPGGGLMSLYKNRLAKNQSDYVQIHKLSNYIDGSVDLLKLDVEGAEGGVIRELSRARKLRRIREIIIEFHHHIPGKTETLSDLLSDLEINSFGYQISTLLRPPMTPEKFQDILIYAYRKDLTTASQIAKSKKTLKTRKDK